MKIKQIPETKIIYKRRIGAYGIENKTLMENFKRWLKDKRLLNEHSIILAIPRDNPENTASQNCRYDVALIVDFFDEFTENEVNKGILKAGEYAIFTIAHTEKAVMQTMQTMFSNIDKKGYIFNEQQPIIERYAVEMIGNGQCEICVPIIKK